MKRAYTQLTEKERQEIARLHLLDWSSRAQLARGFSPEAIAGHWTTVAQRPLSRAPIYQWLRDDPTLPYQVQPRRTASRYARIRDRCFLDQRPVAAHDCTAALHFEGDTLGSPQAHHVRLATATCRTTRFTVIAPVPDRTSASWCAAMAPKLHALRFILRIPVVRGSVAPTNITTASCAGGSRRAQISRR